MCRKAFLMFLVVLYMPLVAMSLSCDKEAQEIKEQDPSSGSMTYNVAQQGLASTDFKVPLSPDYNWQITQSWEEHCEICNDKGYDKIYNDYYGDFCELSHSSSDKDIGGCYSACKYGWDFSLSGSDDLGKPALASADGVVLSVKTKTASGYEAKGWGNTVVIDHGNNICTRYAHLMDDSVTVVKGQAVCQGLKIGEIGGTPSFSPHLHFQFEACDTQEPLKMGFTDGNDEPVCTMDKDIYVNGVYTALKLTNVEKDTCGWYDGDCGTIPGCPRKADCGNEGTPSFGDLNKMDSRTKSAATYLWRECVISGKNDGKFHAEDSLSRAEALKIALMTFGLMNNCNVSESFVDVKPSDWFYPYVLCGLKYKIIKGTYSGFLPNQSVTFSEAAKIAVESANKGGEIGIKFPSKGHFPKIPIEHWAYKYVETVFFYGGINFSVVTKGANDVITRGQYAVMVAALSQCFCESVKCDEDCACDQELYSCEPAYVSTDGDPDWQIGGSGEDDDGDDGQTLSGCIPNCNNKQCGSDGCGGSCGQCTSPFYCYMSNCICQTTTTCIGKQCGSDGCGVSCGQCGANKTCQNGTCVCQPNCNNKQCGSDGCGGSCGQCAGGKQCDANGICKAPPPPAWTCDPAKGYTVYVYSPNGKWEAKISPGGAYYQGPIPGAGTQLSFKFYCNELPATLLVTGGPQTTQIWTQDNTLPSFSVWSPYSGPLVINPSYPADIATKNFYLPSTPNIKTLIRIPSN